MTGKTRDRLITWALLLVVIVSIAAIVPWGRTASEPKRINAEEDLVGCNIGVLKDAAYGVSINACFPHSTIKYYSSFADMIQDLRYGRISAYIATKPIAEAQAREIAALKTLPKSLVQNDYGFVISKDNDALYAELNRAIAELREEGVLQALEQKWIENGDYSSTELALKPEGKRLLKVATYGDLPPFSFVNDGELSGYDVDVIKLAADRIGCKAVVTQYSYGSLLNSIISGTADVAIGCITCTEERQEEFLFTDATYIGDVVAVVLADGEPGALFDGIALSIRKTLIDQQRWKLILGGLGVTTVITVSTLIVGSILGFLIALVLSSAKPAVARMTSIAVKVLDTVPLLIILMLLYYVIFAKLDTSATMIGIAGMTIYFSVNVSQILCTGLRGLDPEQLEAARAMGYNDHQIFNKIAFPQALGKVYDQYIGALTSMVKDTSIVSYITIQDLTNVTDSIRSATYQAFFPLLLAAFIYFLLAKLLTHILSLGLKSFDPNKRKRCVKGVVIDD